MSAYLKYLRAVARTDRPRRKGLDREDYAKAVDAWRNMQAGKTSSFEGVFNYQHESIVPLERPVDSLFVFDPTEIEHILPELSAFHYLATLGDLDIIHSEHVGFSDRRRLKAAFRGSGHIVDLRNQNFNMRYAFRDLHNILKGNALEVDLSSRKELTKRLAYALEIRALEEFPGQPHAKYAAAQLVSHIGESDLLRARAAQKRGAINGY